MPITYATRLCIGEKIFHQICACTSTRTWSLWRPELLKEAETAEEEKKTLKIFHTLTLYRGDKNEYFMTIQFQLHSESSLASTIWNLRLNLCLQALAIGNAQIGGFRLLLILRELILIENILAARFFLKPPAHIMVKFHCSVLKHGHVPRSAKKIVAIKLALAVKVIGYNLRSERFERQNNFDVVYTRLLFEVDCFV